MRVCFHDYFKDLTQFEPIQMCTDGLDQVLQVAHRGFKTLPAFGIVHCLARVLVRLDQRSNLHVVHQSARSITTDVSLECLLDIRKQLVFELIKVCKASSRLV